MKNVLFISYYFEPLKQVGAKRISYWAKYIHDLDNNIICDVITATNDTDRINKNTIRKIYYVPNVYKNFAHPIKDEGLNWKKCLKKFLKGSKLPKYDLVIITGGPFMHFGISHFLKKFFKCKVILDFRDPFANNPRFKNSSTKKLIKKHYEKNFIKNCDRVITVNKYCGELLSIDDKNKLSIIENGYDEKSLKDIEFDNTNLIKDNNIKFVYAGKIHDINTTINFLDVISREENKDKFSFYYIGSDGDNFLRYKDCDNIKILGNKTYKDTLKYIKECDVGMVITSADPFISTTKVFDYIALDKNIFVLTDKTLNKGSLVDILNNYYNKSFWSCSDTNMIDNELKNLFKYFNEDIKITGNIEKNNKKLFSREYGLLKLIELINSLI